MFRLIFIFLALAAVLPARAAAPAATAAMRSGKCLLVLQTGSDWCVSGEAVRKVFESREFARACPGFATAVYDEAENPTDAIKARNASVKDVLVRTKRFPAITCYAPYAGKMRFFAQIENVPSEVDARRLAAAVSKVAAKKDAAVRLFEKAKSAKGSAAADLIGEGFDLIAPLAGIFHAKELFGGKCGWDEEWNALCDLDAGDSLGWKMHFTMDEYASVKMVDEARRSRSRSMLDSLKRIPDAHFTPAQKQTVKIMEFAMSSSGSGAPLSAEEKRLLKETLELERNSLWGQFALGRLLMSGEKIETNPPRRAQARKRPQQNNSAMRPPYPLEMAARAVASVKPSDPIEDEKMRLAIARHAVLRLVGEKAWNEAAARPGGAEFLKAFIDDRTWLEDFAWSGTFPENSTDAWCKSGSGDGDGAKALLALESLVFQDGGRWVPFSGGAYADNEGRRFMTALAIGYPDKSEEWLADVLDAYRATAKAGRLHKRAYGQPVWLWRYALHQGHGTASTDDMAAQQRHLSKFVNLPSKEYGGTCWMIEYRLENCFGDSVHTPLYYKAWATAGEWPKRKYSQIVGGVCGELSKFGSACSNAHGLPSTTAGQPGHCAYTRRLEDGTWEIDYGVTGHTSSHLAFWNKHPWQYTAAVEGTYAAPREKRLLAERRLELARASSARRDKREKTELFYRHACRACPTHYGAWLAYGEWISGGASLDNEKVWVRGCARGMKSGRQPLWDFLTPYFARVAKEKGAKELADTLVEFAPLLRQSDVRIQEEADFSVPLAEWTKPLEKDSRTLAPVLEAMLAAQFGTQDYFAQTLGWGCDAVMKGPGGTETFMKILENVMASKTAKETKGADLDFNPLLLSASKSRNMEAFRRFAALQDRLSPPASRGGAATKDFGGELVSSGGMLVTSSTSQWDTPSRYSVCIGPRSASGNSFHTGKEKSPWAEVVLPGPVEVSGVAVEDRSSAQNRGRQAPLEIQTSENGTDWTTVFSSGEALETYRADLRGSPVRAKSVRVRRTPDAKEDFFHLAKILVYGRKLY